MRSKTIHRLGFWSAVASLVLSIAFIIGVVAGLPKPWDVYIPVGASLLLALSYVMLIVTVHYATDNDRKIWSHLGIAYAILYAAFASIVYVTWLFVVEPQVLRGEANKVAVLIFAPGSFSQILDGLGYSLMMVAAFFTGFAFANRGIERWIRWAGIANGIFAIPVFISYVVYSFILGIWWGITIPIFLLLLAIYFRRAERKKGDSEEVDEVATM